MAKNDKTSKPPVEMKTDEEKQKALKSVFDAIEKEYGTGIFCLAGNCSFTVNWQGELRPCVSLNEPSVPVFERGFEAAWQEIREKAKGLHMNEKCGGCPLRPLCKVCPAAARLETGDYNGVPEYMCRFSAESLRLLEAEE